MDKKAYLLVNFGGPRHLNEIEEFLIALLTDQEVLRTPFPPFLHRFLFTRVAKKRTLKITPDYAAIGGKSPIFDDTQAIAASASRLLNAPIMTFHRYLPKTHAEFIHKIKQIDASEILVFPMFPQFSYSTTGSIALWFKKHLPKAIVDKLRWMKSYPADPMYIDAYAQVIGDFLAEKQLAEEDTFLLFSAHGLPKRYIDTGDVYQEECELSYRLLSSRFKSPSKLCYQSQFGKEEWIRPYTAEVCEQMNEGKQVVIVPLSFTSDHIETLYEIEHIYLPLIEKNGIKAYRCPALNRRPEWIETIAELFEKAKIENSQLIRA